MNGPGVELDALAYAVSHDLRAPIRSVLGYAGALEEDYGARLDDEGRRLLAIVSREASRTLQMLDVLLALSKIARDPLARDTVDMTALARDVASDLAPGQAGRFAIATLPTIVGDRARLRVVWHHLIANAIVATSDVPEARIAITATVEAERVVYAVADNGIGFDMSYAGKLFAAFAKLHHADVFPGPGAGLASVARIVRLHGGDVAVRAGVGEGATFSFALPADAPR